MKSRIKSHRSLAILALLPLACLAQPRPPALHSPDIHPDGTVTFQLAAPKATEVRLTGDLVKNPAGDHEGCRGAC